jgi:hypothetical protein
VKTLVRIFVSLLLSVAALLLTYVLGWYFLLLFDSNYHDGVAFGGAVILGLIAAVATFVAWMKKTRPNR